MLFLFGAWLLLAITAIAVGLVVLRVCRCESLRPGDEVVLAFWVGLVVFALLLLGASLLLPLTPLTGAAIAAALIAGSMLLRGVIAWSPRRAPLVPPAGRTSAAIGITLLAAGAALLAGDPPTLYDSLVYHVGAQKWMREQGLVTGLSLIHVRLGHVSSWFALGAPFEGAPATGRAANVAMGASTLVVGLQAALAVGRLTAGRSHLADWVLLIASAALLWVAIALGAASPSPDVGTNALIVIIVWSMLAIARAESDGESDRWGELATPRLIPFVLAVGAMTVKLFALPAAVVAAAFYVAPSRRRLARAGVCLGVGAVLIAPLLLAGLVTSGCPLFPSPIGCRTGAWSIGASEAATYSDYIRQVARWESRQFLRDAPAAAWIAGWVGAHPIISAAVVLTPMVAARLLRRRHHPGARWAMLAAASGVAFAAWQAPAPRFLFAYVVLVGAVALAGVIVRPQAPERSPLPARQAGTGGRLAFVLASALLALGLAVASQKLNVRSAVASHAPAVRLTPRDLLLPEAPAPPDTLYRWRVNDFDLYTPAAPAIADTLSYHSVIDGDLGFEKCSAAPLPCTPYLPDANVALRRPERGLSGGFTRLDGSTLGGVRCLGRSRAAGPRTAPRSGNGATRPDVGDSTGCESRGATAAARGASGAR